MNKKNIALIAGGDSSEAIVSLKSAAGIRSFLKNEDYNLYTIVITGKKWYYEDEQGLQIDVDKNDFSILVEGQKTHFDFAYIIIHGTPGENGILQGYFDLMGIPYSTCGVMASAVTFNKYICNKLLKSFGIAVADSVVLRKNTKVEEASILAQLGLPCFVKPNVGGSSFGVTKVKTAEALVPAIEAAFAEGEEVIIEAFMKGTEVTCGCYMTDGEPKALPITEVVTENEFFDYDAKYVAGQADEITPARISAELTQEIQQCTERIYQLLDCRGIIRVDYIIIEGRPHLLEVNTTPGMTPTSFIPQQIAAAGLEIGNVLSQIIEAQIKRVNA